MADHASPLKDVDLTYDPTAPLDARVSKSILEAEAIEISHLVDKALAKFSSVAEDPAIESLLAGENSNLRVDFDDVRDGQSITIYVVSKERVLRVIRPDGPGMPASVLDRLDAAQSTLALLSRCITMCIKRGCYKDDPSMLSPDRDKDEAQRLDHIAMAVRTLVDDENLDIIAPRSPWGPARIESSQNGDRLEGFDEFAGNLMVPFVWLQIGTTPTMKTIRLLPGERFIPFEQMQPIDAMRFIVEQGITENQMASIGIAPKVAA